MSLFVLATGTLIADPQQRTGQSGKPFVTATLRTPTDGEDGAVLVSAICFDLDAQAVLAMPAQSARLMTMLARSWFGPRAERLRR